MTEYSIRVYASDFKPPHTFPHFQCPFWIKLMFSSAAGSMFAGMMLRTLVIIYSSSITFLGSFITNFFLCSPYSSGSQTF
jgi:hypothetical protein